MRIKPHYQRVIREIMKDCGISPTYQWHVISKNARFEEVVAYTDHYVGKGNDERPNAQPHYRYHRYRELLSCLKPREQREAQVDLGCGAGLFSWVFLDWAVSKGFDLGHVDLYGLDHCQAMIRLAEEIRYRLMHHTSNYPVLRYSHNPESLLKALTENHCKDTDYTITFGHVLAQAHNANDLKAFTRVIAHILELMDARSTCVVLAVDALYWQTDFETGWSALLKCLGSANIRSKQHPVPCTEINDSRRARIASLYLAQ